MSEGLSRSGIRGFIDRAKAKLSVAKVLARRNAEAPIKESKDELVNLVIQKVTDSTANEGFTLVKKKEGNEQTSRYVRLKGIQKYYEAAFHVSTIGEHAETPYSKSVHVIVFEFDSRDTDLYENRKHLRIFSAEVSEIKISTPETWSMFRENQSTTLGQYSTYSEVPTKKHIRTSIGYRNPEKYKLSYPIDAPSSERYEGELPEQEQIALLKRILQSEVDPEATQIEYQRKMEFIKKTSKEKPSLSWNKSPLPAAPNKALK